LSRVINPDSVGKERNQLVKSVVVALRVLMSQEKADEHTYDLAAYIILALRKIADSIDLSVVAWEKRGYWVKADRFRIEWMWTGEMSEAMRNALYQNDLGSIASNSAKIASKLHGVKVPVNHRMGTPWVGAWDLLQSK